MGWRPNHIEHTFRSGRSATLRDGLPLSILALDALKADSAEVAGGIETWAAGGDITDAAVAGRVMQTIMEALFVRPKLYWDEADLPEGVSEEEAIAAIWLAEEDIEEVLEIAQGGLAAAKRFRNGHGRDDAGPGGEGVGKPAKRARGTTARKR